MSGLGDLARVVITRELFHRGHAMLREIGESDVEGLVLWAGTRRDAMFEVEAVLRPAQRCVSGENGLCVLVDGPELHRINVWLYRERMQLVAQVHTHPTVAYHSDTDDAIPIVTTVGGLSLVVPDFARGASRLDTYAAFRLDELGMWKELSGPALHELVHIADQPIAHSSR